MPDAQGLLPRDTVTLVVPQREHVQARVDVAAARWVDLTLLSSPLTAWHKLERMHVSLEFAGPRGLCRLMGRLGPRPHAERLRVVGYGVGEDVRFEHNGNVQLLLRRTVPEPAGLDARIMVLRSGAPDEVVADARCVAIAEDRLRIRGLTSAAVGQRFEFVLQLDTHEPAVEGEFVVERTDPAGLDARLTRFGARDRGRLVHWTADHTSPQVVA